MRITESQLRKVVKQIILAEQKLVPGDAPGDKQVHVFDFDDTLGVTRNSNGIMIYRDGKPAWKTAEDVKTWMKDNGIPASDILDPGIKKIDRLDGYSVYLSSSGLAKAQKLIPKEKQGVVFQDSENKATNATGEGLLIDFSPSGSTDEKSTKPIDSTISKLKQANSVGAETAVVTARKSSGEMKDFEGNTIEVTNAKDMKNFLSSQGAAPSMGVIGVTGSNKGYKIRDLFFDREEHPEEVHFYDDLQKNTQEVEDALAEKIPSELFVYGPGEFDKGEADPENPTDSFPPESKSKNESRGKHGDPVLERWKRLAGIL